MSHTHVQLKVWGDLALFSRADTPSEQVSYACMTPSAARAILEAVFWKPEFMYVIQRIHILKPIKYLSVTRNEGAKVIAAKIPPEPYYIDEDRQQRHALYLQDVAYVIEAKIVLRPHTTDHIRKYIEMFERRVRKGRCHRRPYLGTRECSADFAAPTEADRPISLDFPIGSMTLDFQFPTKEEKHLPIPHYFTAIIRNGVMEVPSRTLEEVHRLVLR